ncbi:hypothetical protein HTG_06270 [Natrinema mahii]|nr:hypothetical protein HTG_06270 [Natrinema mahii]
MCTLTLAWQVFEEAPVAVAANRDEAIGRASEPPGVYREEPLIVAPRDAEAGGTWIGYNDHGVFVGITNKWATPDLAGERSRGLLVADVLEARSAAEARSIVADATEADEYNGFYLVVADADAAVCYQWDGDLALTEFGPGVHVVVNVAVDDDVDVPAGRAAVGREQAANARAVRTALAPDPDETVGDWLERGAAVLSDHDYGVCIHQDGFGTRSSSLLALGPETTRYEFAPGPPCRTSYDAVSLPERASGAVEDERADSPIDGEGHI